MTMRHKYKQQFKKRHFYLDNIFTVDKTARHVTGLTFR